MTQDIQATLNAALTKHQSGDLDGAIEAYQDILSKQHAHPAALQLLGIAVGQSGDLATARTCFEHALANTPNDPSLLGNYATVLKQLGEFTLAGEHFQKVIKLDPKNPVLANNYGALLMKQAQFEQAKEQFTHAVALKPDYADALFNLGCVEQKLDHQEEAKTHFEHCLKIDNTYEGAHNQLAQFAQAAGDNVLAIQHFKACIAINPDHADAQQNLGVLILKQGDEAYAKRCFERALQADPHHPEAHHNLASLALRSGDIQLALKHFLNAHEQMQTLESTYNVAVCLMDLERHTDAIDYFEAALKINPKHINSLLNLAAVYLRQYDHEAAAKQYQSVLRIQPNNRGVQYLLAALGKADSSTHHRAPSDYVEGLFDHYANHFDQHLQSILGYQVPNHLREVIAKRLAIEPEQQWTILDLGCGTGLCGEALSPWAHQLLGVDLSKAMLNQAQKKQCYNQLMQGEILEALARCIDNDLVMAGDVLPYLGDLQPLFQAVVGALKPQGYWLFTVEHCPAEEATDTGYVLRPTARFAHPEHYVRHLLKENGFNVLAYTIHVLRTDAQSPIKGAVILSQLA